MSGEVLTIITGLVLRRERACILSPRLEPACAHGAGVDRDFSRAAAGGGGRRGAAGPFSAPGIFYIIYIIHLEDRHVRAPLPIP